MQMQVRHIEARDDQRGPRTLEGLLLSAPDDRGDLHQMGQQGIIGLGEGHHLLARHDQHVSVADRFDGGEDHADLVRPREHP